MILKSRLLVQMKATDDRRLSVQKKQLTILPPADYKKFNLWKANRPFLSSRWPRRVVKSESGGAGSFPCGP
jgi:hypothetical protein